MRFISEKELKDLVNGDPNITVINVLSSDAYEREHIPNSINIAVENENFLQEVKSQVKDKDDPIIVYCASYECPASTNAAKFLEESGYTNVLDFKGGMEEWRTAGNEVTANA